MALLPSLLYPKSYRYSVIIYHNQPAGPPTFVTKYVVGQILVMPEVSGWSITDNLWMSSKGRGLRLDFNVGAGTNAALNTAVAKVMGVLAAIKKDAATVDVEVASWPVEVRRI